MYTITEITFLVVSSFMSICSFPEVTAMGHDKDHMDDMDDMPGMNNKSDDMHGMKMQFHTGYKETILFSEWKISTISGLIGSMVGIFLLAMIYEGLKFLREFLFKKHVGSLQYTSVAAISNNSQQVTQIQRIQRNAIFSWSHAIQTLMHMVQIVISYFLMLIFMTYNVWLCLAIVLGAGVGYFIFGWKKASVVDVTEHCH